MDETAGVGAVALILGESGAGKTTLALALRRLGAKLLADDVVYVRRAGSGVECFPQPEEIHVRPQAAGLLPDGGVNAPRGAHGKLMLPFEGLGASIGRPAPVICTAVVDHVTESSELRPAPASRTSEDQEWSMENSRATPISLHSLFSTLHPLLLSGSPSKRPPFFLHIL